MNNKPLLVEVHCRKNELLYLSVCSNDTLLSYLDCSFNNLKFSTLPILSINHYDYMVQSAVFGEIKHYTDTIELSNEYIINGNATVYE